MSWFNVGAAAISVVGGIASKNKAKKEAEKKQQEQAALQAGGGGGPPIYVAPPTMWGGTAPAPFVSQDQSQARNRDNFDSAAYSKMYGDSEGYGGGQYGDNDNWEHYQQTQRLGEGRNFSYKASSDLPRTQANFDANAYHAENPDVMRTGYGGGQWSDDPATQAWEHYNEANRLGSARGFTANTAPANNYAAAAANYMGGGGFRAQPSGGSRTQDMFAQYMGGLQNPALGQGGPAPNVGTPAPNMGMVPGAGAQQPQGGPYPKMGGLLGDFQGPYQNDMFASGGGGLLGGGGAQGRAPRSVGQFYS